MSSPVQIIQIKCPNCGSQHNSIGAFSQTRTCSYCKTEFHVTGTMSKEMDAPERMVPFFTSKDDFERNVLTFLVNDDLAPDNIFDLTSFDEVEGVYLPMFLYEGKYDCSWNCSVGYKENEVKVGSTLGGDTTLKNKTVMKFRPMNGSNRGNYSFVCIAYNGSEVKPELADYARTFPYDASVAKSFDPKFLEGYNFLLHNQDKETTWDKWGNKSVKEFAEKESLRNVPGDTFKDFSASVATDPRHDGRLVFIPFWAIYYTYNNQTFFVLMDGTGNNGVFGSTPIDEERQKKFELWNKIPKWTKWAAYLSLLLILAGQFMLAVTAFLLFFLGAFVLKMVGKSIYKSTVAASRAIRQAKMDAIVGGSK